MVVATSVRDGAYRHRYCMSHHTTTRHVLEAVQYGGAHTPRAMYKEVGGR